ncbi:hypothetical protein HKX48_009510 [Thoreauomyces humboldtii]|nr:hypothetical protein HKX48_009510 [Thoreauomyces humboldtii]
MKSVCFFDKFDDAAFVIGKLRETYPNVNTFRNYVKLCIKLCKNATHEDKMAVLKVPLFMQDEANEQKITNTFKEQIHDKYSAALTSKASSCLDATNPAPSPLQELSEKDSESYVPYSRLQQVLTTQLAKLTFKNMRRINIGMTRLVYPDTKAVNVEDSCTLEISDPVKINIKSCNKTAEKNVDLVFDDSIRPYVKLLVDARVAANQQYLFMTTRSRKSNPDQAPRATWFASNFNNRMIKLFDGKSVNTRLMRIAVGIHLSKDDHGDQAYQDHICRMMGHNYDTHQKHYNLYKNLEESN